MNFSLSRSEPATSVFIPTCVYKIKGHDLPKNKESAKRREMSRKEKLASRKNLSAELDFLGTQRLREGKKKVEEGKRDRNK